MTRYPDLKCSSRMQSPRVIVTDAQNRKLAAEFATPWLPYLKFRTRNRDGAGPKIHRSKSCPSKQRF